MFSARLLRLAPALLVIALSSPPALAQSSGACGEAPRCVAIHFAVFKKPGKAEAPLEFPEAQFRKNLAGVNKIWNSCGIGFVLDQVGELDYASEGVVPPLKNFDQLEATRKKLIDSKYVLFLITGPWAKGGTLRNGPDLDIKWKDRAGGWTFTSSTLVNGKVYASQGNILMPNTSLTARAMAHELGHVLGLGHELKDQTNLMNEIPYGNDQSLNPEQCQLAAETLTYGAPQTERAP